MSQRNLRTFSPWFSPIRCMAGALRWHQLLAVYWPPPTSCIWKYPTGQKAGSHPIWCPLPWRKPSCQLFGDLCAILATSLVDNEVEVHLATGPLFLCCYWTGGFPTKRGHFCFRLCLTLCRLRALSVGQEPPWIATPPSPPRPASPLGASCQQNPDRWSWMCRDGGQGPSRISCCVNNPGRWCSHQRTTGKEQARAHQSHLHKLNSTNLSGCLLCRKHCARYQGHKGDKYPDVPKLSICKGTSCGNQPWSWWITDMCSGG